jgi:hypothetical protein
MSTKKVKATYNSDFSLSEDEYLNAKEGRRQKYKS